MANVVAVSHIRQLESSQRSKFFFQGKKVRQSLARMKTVRERIDNGNVRVSSHLTEHFLLIHTRNNSLHPQFQVARHIPNRFTLAQPRLRVIEKYCRTAHALNSHFKRYPRSQ